jgi:two-component system, LytTR family, sensor kinase
MEKEPLVQDVRAATRIDRRLLIPAIWVLVVLVFAAQWYGYDAGHHIAEPFVDYLGWSCYIWGVLTPIGIWFAGRHPINAASWRRAVPLHLAASLLLATVQLSLEASIKWLRTGGEWPLRETLRHYLSQHTEVVFLAYWALVGSTEFYRTYDQARVHQLHAVRLEALLAEARLGALRAQIQPHFLFNTLQAATVLIHEEPDGAEEILLRLSELLRISLDEAHTQEIPLRREIEFLEHYTRIQQLRFGDRLRFTFEVDPNLMAVRVPSLVLQPLVENAICHGIGKHKENDVVTIRVFQQLDRLFLEVSNVTGTLQDTPERLVKRGIGLSNTRARIEQLYGQEQSLRLFNLQPRGVAALLSIPARRSLSEESVPAIAIAK